MMELNGNDFVEELLALTTETWETRNPIESHNDDQSFLSSLSFESFGYSNNPLVTVPDSSCQSVYEKFNSYSSLLLDEVSGTQITQYSFSNTVDTSLAHAPPFMAQEDPLSLIEENDPSFLGMDLGNVQSPEMIQVFNFGTCTERKNRAQKLQGQPSKNLMAERRRRKKLNDRLSMLRAIVPKISKMDRTSILGDTIEYMKELLEKYNRLQQESDQEADVKSNMEGIFNFKDSKSNEMLVTNSPKFDVEKMDDGTRKIDVCCSGKPWLLQTMVNTLEGLGLEIQHCVISCFHDFAVQACCSQELDNRTSTSSDDIKQALLRNSGYGGRCL